MSSSKNHSPNETEPLPGGSEFSVVVQADPVFVREAGETILTLLEEVVRETLRSEGIGGPLEVGLVIAGDEQIREYNRAYLGRDRPTDVISFPSERAEAGDAFVTAPGEIPYLGDVIVSYETAGEQGPEFGHSMVEEVKYLVVHGILHLLDYDDRTDEERQAMLAKQDAILARLERGR
jgi:probable rRNA maturation factor